MKRLLALTLAVGALLISTACTAQAPRPESQTYTVYGRYYTNGTVITDDGNEWNYSTDNVSNVVPYDAMPVWVGMDDNGTPNNVEDDVILGLVYDLNTAVYDKLEKALSEEFEVERNGNNIKINGGTKK